MEEPQIDVLDIEAVPLLESMQPKLHALLSKRKETNNFTIFRTPHNISQSKKNLFEPSVISIGPFHRDKEHLRALEEQKWQFLQDFLSRSHISLDLCISEMKLLEKRTRGCYSETIHLKSNAFVQMMLLDGCFVLEYFFKLFKNNWTSLFEVGWNSYFVIFDLLLLENQIPFFIVEKLYDIGLKQEDRMNFLNKLVFLALELTSGSIYSKIPYQLPQEILHLVHLYYHCLVPTPEEPVLSSSKSFCLTRMFSANRIKVLIHRFRSSLVRRGGSPHSTSGSLSVELPNSTQDISSMVIPCATELKQKGVKFTPKNNPKHMLDISFEYGALEIPKLVITDSTKPHFLNLIAFEHSKYGKRNKPLTSFVIFLDNLVNTQNDVTILQQCGIVENCLGSEEALTHFFNHVTEGGFIGGDHYLAKLNTEVNIYIGSSWNKHRAKFIRDYFSSPWKAISLIAAFILLVLTLVQSFFSVFAYFRPPSP